MRRADPADDGVEISLPCVPLATVSEKEMVFEDVEKKLSWGLNGQRKEWKKCRERTNEKVAALEPISSRLVMFPKPQEENGEWQASEKRCRRRSPGR